MSKDSGKGIKEKEPVKESDETRPVEEVPRTNTGVEIDNPEEMEEAGKED